MGDCLRVALQPDDVRQDALGFLMKRSVHQDSHFFRRQNAGRDHIITIRHRDDFDVEAADTVERAFAKLSPDALFPSPDLVTQQVHIPSTLTNELGIV